MYFVISTVDGVVFANLMRENECLHHMIQIGLSILQYALLLHFSLFLGPIQEDELSYPSLMNQSTLQHPRLIQQLTFQNSIRYLG